MMPDKESKKKALDLMIVLGGPKPKKGMEEEGEDMKCECPCCGRECSYCKKGHKMEDMEEEDYEEEDEEY